HGVGDALVRAVASGASRLGERVNTGVPFVGRPLGPFPMRGVRGDSRYTSSVHGVLLSDALWANEGRKRSTAAVRARRRGQDGHIERGQTLRLLSYACINASSCVRPGASGAFSGTWNSRRSSTTPTLTVTRADTTRIFGACVSRVQA